MVDPNNITQFNRTEYELQELLAFSVLVAGKKASTVARQLQRLLFMLYDETNRNSILKTRMYPLDLLAVVSEAGLAARLKANGIGCHTQKAKTLWHLGELTSQRRINLSTCCVDELEAVPGIGPKTSRFFVLHSRPDQRLAVLDTHILKYLRAKGVKDVPKSTPTGAAYARLEAEFLKLADADGLPPAAYDLEIWRHYANK